MRSKRLRFSTTAVPYFVRAVDALAIIVAGVVALAIRKSLALTADFSADWAGYYGLIFAGGILLPLIFGGGQRSWRGAQMAAMLAKVATEWLTVSALLLLWLFTFKASQDYSRVWFFTWVLIGVGLLWITHFFAYLLLRSIRRKGINLRHVVLIGSGDLAEQIQRQVIESGWSGYKVVSHLKSATELDIANLATQACDEVWLALPLGDEQMLRQALHALRHTAASIRFVPDLFTVRLVNHGMTEIVGFPMYDLSATPLTGINLFVKWLEDKVIASLILLMISPLLLFIALGVKLSSRGPILYRQERVGLNNKTFQMLKFRSMPVDVEKNGINWGGASAKATSKFGQFIRRTSLDELPQFINVLIGDMSIVGPRPERPMFVEQFKDEIPNYMKKHLVKGGITGWAQINGWRGDTDLKIRIEHDLYYIANWSLMFDLKIIFLTVFKGFIHKNAY